MKSLRPWFLLPFFAAACGAPIEEPADSPPSDPEAATVETTADALSPAAWTANSSLVSYASPALATADGVLWQIAVNTAGSLQASTDQTFSGGWSPWTAVAGGHPASTAFATDTAPVLLADGSTLHALGRGADGNLYRATKSGSGAWSAWTALTTHGRVRGRISAALSRRLNFVAGRIITVLVTNVVFTGVSGAVEYHRLEGTSLVGSSSFQSAVDGVVAASPTDEVWVAIHGSSSIGVHRATQQLNGSWGWTSIGSRSAGIAGRIYDLSNLEWFAGAFHFTYSLKRYFLPDYNSGFYLYHTRFIAGQSDDAFIRSITSFSPSQDPDAAADTLTGPVYPQATLEVYRNKLVAAYRMSDGAVRYARWDNADPSAPWVGNAAIGSMLAYRRPALAPFNGRPSGSGLSTVNYSDDLFAAVTGVWTVNVYNTDFSRAIAKLEVDAQFTLWQATGADDSTCGPVTASSLSIANEDRPIMTELGYALWTLPNWFDRAIYAAQAQFFCANEPYRTNWIGSGRVSDPCSSAKMPVIIKPAEGPFYCRGIWVGQENNALRIFEELGHYLAHALGLGDDVPGPSSANATRAGISLANLTTAATLFNEGRSGCAIGPTRCTGFTGIANNYDSNSREHSFIYIVYYYLLDGAAIRGMVTTDLNGGSDLLQRKYNWVKDNIFKGVEFKLASDPVRPL